MISKINFKKQKIILLHIVFTKKHLKKQLIKLVQSRNIQKLLQRLINNHKRKLLQSP
jgi:hypothetical protein